jgi:hypothetical protein
MKKLLFLAFSGVLAYNTASSQNVATARGMALNSNVTVRGVVINGPELGIIRYVQDVTGGIGVYGSNVSALQKGDSVLVNGTLTEFKNLFEITPATFTVISGNGHVPNPAVITPSQFGESNEGTLVKIMNCQFSASGTFSTAAANYTVSSNGQSFEVRTNTVIGGSSIPTGTVNIIGVGSQYCATPVSGCTTGYQLLVRTMSDFTTGTTSTVVTGISENEATSNIVSLFPNPAHDEINFRLSANDPVASILIADISGRVVYSSNENRTTVDIKGYPKGLYTISIATARNSYHSKFIVE